MGDKVRGGAGSRADKCDRRAACNHSGKLRCSLTKQTFVCYVPEKTQRDGSALRSRIIGQRYGRGTCTVGGAWPCPCCCAVMPWQGSVAHHLAAFWRISRYSRCHGRTGAAQVPADAWVPVRVSLCRLEHQTSDAPLIGCRTKHSTPFSVLHRIPLRSRRPPSVATADATSVESVQSSWASWARACVPARVSE